MDRLTLVTTCKPFEGGAFANQRNALRSWAALDPRPEILVAGDEPGVRGVCAELGLHQVPDIERSEEGTPLLSGLVAVAEREAKSGCIALVNADIILASRLSAAVRRVADHFERFLMIARRWNVDLDGEIDTLQDEWEARLRAHVGASGVLEPRFGGVDLFVFPVGVWGDDPLPPFSIGRGRWDSAMIYQARRRGIPVIDATECTFSVHPNHDYSHHPQGTRGVFTGPEGGRNERLLGGEEFIFSGLNATHVLSETGLRRNRLWNPLLLARRWATAPALNPRLRPLAGWVRRLAPLWRRGRRALSPASGDYQP